MLKARGLTGWRWEESENAMNREQKEEYATKLTLIGLFFAIFIAFSSRMNFKNQSGKAVKVKPFDLAMLGISTYRLGRLAAYDKVSEPLRLFFTETVPDETGAGETVAPKGQGIQRTLGELLSCPICAGTWIAAVLVYALHIITGPTRVFITIMSSIGLAELLNALTEALSWLGQAARKEAGNNHQ